MEAIWDAIESTQESPRSLEGRSPEAEVPDAASEVTGDCDGDPLARRIYSRSFVAKKQSRTALTKSEALTH